MSEVTHEIATALHRLWEFLLELGIKFWALFLSISLGVVGKLSHNMLNGKRLTWRQAMGQVGVCITAGVLAHMLCVYMGWTKADGIITACATYLSDKLMLALYSIDWTDKINSIVNLFLKKKSD